MKDDAFTLANQELLTPLKQLRHQARLGLKYLRSGQYDELEVILKTDLEDLEKLDHRLNSFLTLIAIDNKTILCHQRWLKVSSICGDIDQEFSGRPGVKLIWECCADERRFVEVYSDDHLIKIMFRDALENALTHTTSGIVTVSMTCHDSGISVSIQDRGNGLSAEDLDSLKWLTNPPGQELTRNEQGWGSGLLTIKRIADYLDGKITIESQAGHGAKLEIFLPVIWRMDLAKPLTKIADTPQLVFTQDVSAVSKEKLRILLMDSNLEYLEQMRRIFQPSVIFRDGVTLKTCSDPTEGFRLIEEQRFDLLLLDVHMPKLDGVKFLKWLGAGDHLNSKMVKIVLTADPQIPAETRLQIATSGARILSKGLRINELRELVDHVMFQQSAA